MSIARQLEMKMEAAYNNQYLFSDHYLDHLLPAEARWEEGLAEAEALLGWLGELYDQEQNQLAAYNESQLEEHWFKPILARLGHVFEPQASIPGLGKGIKRPDYVFFPTEAARQAAVSSQKSSEYAAQALVVGEVKQWEVPLGKKQKGGGATFDAQNPSFQIDYYLRTTGLSWGVLSNGRQWRLVHIDSSLRMSIYYEVDLVGLIEGGEAGPLRYFSLFFGAGAFRPDGQGRVFLNEALAASRAYSRALEADLKQNVYQALERLMQGFLDLPANRLGEADLRSIYDNSLYLLYRLLFVLYGESRGLLPMDNPNYRDHYSLDRLKRQFARLPGLPAPMTQTYWGDVQQLFQIINGDDEGLNRYLGVPRYNGGLFEPEQHPFLVEKAVGDRALVEAINLLTWRERAGQHEFVDYRTLGVRQLGSIYEGLLEYQPGYASEPMVAVRESRGKGERWIKAGAAPKKGTIVERREPGQIYLETDKGERKATGSYYTPQYIVEYIVENTLGPLVEAGRERVKARVRQAKNKAARAEAEQSLIEEVLSLKVLDPAMGSGHFLVEATEYLGRALATDPYVETETVTEEDLSHWRRRVVERCIYGVDKNPLAVELAKLSLWLATVAADKPLSFIDHHLKCGDALVGARVADLGEVPPVLLSKKARQERQKLAAAGARQANLFEQRLSEKLPVVMGKILEITGVESDSYETVQAKEAADRAVQQLKAPFETMADLWTSAYFGHTFKQGDYYAALDQLSQPAGLLARPEIAAAQAVARDRQRNFFHWELAFPEVFYDRNGQPLGDRAGFDAVVGNPPYVNVVELSKEIRDWFLNTYEFATGRVDIYLPFFERALKLLTRGGRTSFITPNKWFVYGYGLPSREAVLRSDYYWLSAVDLSLAPSVFEDAETYCQISIFQKPLTGQSRPNIQIVRFRQDRPEFILNLDQAFALNIIDRFEASPEFFIQMPQTVFSARLNSLSQNILRKALKISEEVSRYFDVEQLIRIGSAQKRAKLIVRESNEKGARKIIDADEIGRWEINWKGRYLLYHPKELYNPKTPDIFESPKIFVKDTSRRLQVVPDMGEEKTNPNLRWYYALNTVYALIPHEVNSDFIRYVSSCLNSLFLDYLYKQVFGALTIGGGYIRFREFIQYLPIRRIHFTTPETERQEHLARLVEQYEQNDHTRLLAEVEQLLPKDAQGNFLGFLEEATGAEEKSDVIHDLLAYLAGQMIEMNKDKQAGAGAFWLDLEGVADEALFAKLQKGKQESTLARQAACLAFVKAESHSSRRLEESLAWDEGAFKAFVKVLAGKVPGLSGLVEVYRSHSPAYGQLVRRLEVTDRLIDQIVYGLYGLTAEEIEIVEEANE